MDAHELNTWLILGTLFLLCLVGLGIGIYDTMKQKKEKSLSASRKIIMTTQENSPYTL